LNQLEERLTNLKDEYHQMKTQFEQQIKYLEVNYSLLTITNTSLLFQESTAQLLTSIDVNRKRVIETTPDFERLKEEHEKVIANYESAKEIMIETKRKKQEILDKIASAERDIRDKNRSRDITMLAVKECQRETQEYMQKAHEDMLKLEEDIYEKGCRLETLENESERFQNVILSFSDIH